MDASDYDRFFTNLGEVMSITPELARDFIYGYTTGTGAFLDSYFQRLPIANIVNGTSSESGVESLVVKETNVGEGRFGKVMRNISNPFAYKERRKSSGEIPTIYFESIFNEIIIQTLLQNDPTYGKYVCRIFKVFRKKGEHTIFIKMEQLTTTLQQVYETIDEDKRFERSNELKAILIKLFTILIHFRDKYAFQHLDFHMANIMIAPHEGDILSNLKIIDFGLSRIVIPGVITIFGGSSNKDGKTIIESILSRETPLDINSALRTLLNSLNSLPPETPLETYRAALLPHDTSLETYLPTIMGTKLTSGGERRRKRRYRTQITRRRQPKKKRSHTRR